jgi:phage FluMu protein Com
MEYMTFNKETLEATCNKCFHSWRARTEYPRKCPSCTSVNWNDSGNRKYPVIVSRSCGKEETGNRMVFCILERVESPDIISEDIFYMKEEDVNNYLRGSSYPAGSAVVFVGDMEVNSEGELIVNEMNLIYIHEKAFRAYSSGVKCAYNLASYYERQKSYKRLEEIREQEQAALAERRKLNLEEKKKQLDEEQLKINMKRQILAEIEGE